jgi:hypothetical protein
LPTIRLWVQEELPWGMEEQPVAALASRGRQAGGASSWRCRGGTAWRSSQSWPGARRGGATGGGSDNGGSAAVWRTGGTDSGGSAADDGGTAATWRTGASWTPGRLRGTDNGGGAAAWTTSRAR